MKNNSGNLTAIKKICTDYQCKVIGAIGKISLRDFKQVLLSDKWSTVWVSRNYFQKNIFQNKIKLNANCVITDDESIANSDNFNADVFIVSDSPKIVFSLLYSLSNPKRYAFKGIHPSAVIHEKARIHSTAHIGPLTYIGYATIGKNTSISGSCFIGDNVWIGEHCLIEPNVSIGVEGFGHGKDKNGNWLQFPQKGNTVIEDNVEIGASTYITKGALGTTHIKPGVVVGLMCGIGHNVVLERNAYITSKSIIGGSSVIGKNAVVGMQAVIRDDISIGQNSLIGMGSIVTKSIPDNEIWVGNPAKFFKKNIKKKQIPPC